MSDRTTRQLLEYYRGRQVPLNVIWKKNANWSDENNNDDNSTAVMRRRASVHGNPYMVTELEKFAPKISRMMEVMAMDDEQQATQQYGFLSTAKGGPPAFFSELRRRFDHGGKYPHGTDRPPVTYLSTHYVFVPTTEGDVLFEGQLDGKGRLKCHGGECSGTLAYACEAYGIRVVPVNPAVKAGVDDPQYYTLRGIGKRHQLHGAVKTAAGGRASKKSIEDVHKEMRVSLQSNLNALLKIIGNDSDNDYDQDDVISGTDCMRACLALGGTPASETKLKETARALGMGDGLRCLWKSKMKRTRLLDNGRNRMLDHYQGMLDSRNNKAALQFFLEVIHKDTTDISRGRVSVEKPELACNYKRAIMYTNLAATDDFEKLFVHPMNQDGLIVRFIMVNSPRAVGLNIKPADRIHKPDVADMDDGIDIQSDARALRACPLHYDNLSECIPEQAGGSHRRCDPMRNVVKRVDYLFDMERGIERMDKQRKLNSMFRDVSAELSVDCRDHQTLHFTGGADSILQASSARSGKPACFMPGNKSGVSDRPPDDGLLSQAHRSDPLQATLACLPLSKFDLMKIMLGISSGPELFKRLSGTDPTRLDERHRDLLDSLSAQHGLPFPENSLIRQMAQTDAALQSFLNKRINSKTTESLQMSLVTLLKVFSFEITVHTTNTNNKQQFPYLLDMLKTTGSLRGAMNRFDANAMNNNANNNAKNNLLRYSAYCATGATIGDRARPGCEPHMSWEFTAKLLQHYRDMCKDVLSTNSKQTFQQKRPEMRLYYWKTIFNTCMNFIKGLDASNRVIQLCKSVLSDKRNLREYTERMKSTDPKNGQFNVDNVGVMLVTCYLMSRPPSAKVQKRRIQPATVPNTPNTPATNRPRNAAANTATDQNMPNKPATKSPRNAAANTATDQNMPNRPATNSPRNAAANTAPDQNTPNTPANKRPRPANSVASRPATKSPRNAAANTATDQNMPNRPATKSPRNAAANTATDQNTPNTPAKKSPRPANSVASRWKEFKRQLPSGLSARSTDFFLRLFERRAKVLNMLAESKSERTTEQLEKILKKIHFRIEKRLREIREETRSR